ncbi:MAG: Maf family nucleotide pyrophosphatase [Candidatus Aceula meridiana]|nr:Maf family nucleotide pyrophosphatase [Candidatus Aceula meridiana]
MKKLSPNIILASKSIHRRRLLKKLGIPFKVIPSRAEEKSILTQGAAHLVKANALLKAQDVAARLDKGVVIGSDTLVFTHKKKVVGKPKSIKEAKKNLKALMCAPHWLYSGVAIVDAKTKKTLVDFEKTKIVMERLTDKEIDSYYRHTSSKDKAGGFDIDGKGAFFIKRIEGCYFNIVGLPMAKLCKMLKKFGVSILMLIVCFCFTGCVRTEYNLATEQEEMYFISTEREIAMGESIVRYVEKNFEINTDIDINERVSKIVDRLSKVCDRKELLYSGHVITKDDEVNAFALPGGPIYVFTGLINEADTDDELAGVIAHEFAHITAKHAIKRLQAQYGYSLLMVLAATSGNARMAQGVSLAFASIISSYSRADEIEADKLAVKYLKKAGYDPRAMETFLEKLHALNAKRPSRPFSYWRTHPYTSQRIATVSQEITGETTFRDYIRLTEEQESYK